MTDSGDAATRRAVFLINVEFTEGEPDLYALPLSAAPENPASTDTGILLFVSDGAGNRWTIQDGMTDGEFAPVLLDTALVGRSFPGQTVRLVGRRIPANAPCLI